MNFEKTILSEQELIQLNEIIRLLRKSKFSEFFGDISGIISRITDMIHINPSAGGENNFDFIDFEKIPESWGSDFLAPLIDHISKKQVIEIYYHPFYEDKPYFIHVHPYLLKEFRHRWYLIGLNDQKKELRTYGLDRIWEIKAINKPFIPMNFSAKEYFKNTVGVISPTGTPPKIKIEVRKPQAQYLITQPIHSSQSIDFEDGEKIIFTYLVHPTYELKTMLLGLGSDVKVIEPVNLKEEIIKEVKDTLNNYHEE